MPLFYLRSGRARCQVDCGLSLACIMDVLLSAFRREYLNWHQKICSDAIEIRERSVYNDSEHLCGTVPFPVYSSASSTYLMQIFVKNRGI